MTNFFKKEWPFILLLIIPFLVAILVYPHMPDKVPMHWNIQGEVDKYESRGFGTFFIPVFNLFLYIMFIITPYLDPKKNNYKKFKSSYSLIRIVVHFFMVFIYVLTILAALGYSVDIGLWISAGVALLFILIGNVLGRFRHNYFVGIKMPWTLANEEVWRKTHLIGSKLMVAGGVLALIGVILTEGTARFIILMAGIFIPITITTIYSYLYFKKLQT